MTWTRHRPRWSDGTVSDTSPAGAPATGGGPAPSADAVGDPVCWLDRLCPDCGAMPSPDEDGAPPQTCWRCGAAVPS